MLNSLRDRLSRGLQQSPAPVAAYEDEDEHEPERRQANPKRVIHHIESSIERVTQFGEFLVTNLRNKLEAADLDENAGRGEGGEAEAEQPKSVKVYGAGTLPAGLEDLRRSDLFAKESVGESRRRDGEAGRKNSAAGAEEGWEDVSDQTSQGSAARSAGQDELEVAWKPTFHDMSLLGVRKEIRSMWETSYASGKAIIHETMQEMVQGQQAGAGVKGLQREVYIKERNGAAEAFFSALGQQPISVVQLRRAGFFGVPDDKTDLR
ncbi:hypothetical protein GUITHDRAFT_112816 [Guillardia theta CCMP2712]|uniref:Uncharacterized protein n=2 Tax=Guillardia theta TaxID=55529 RepID=L1IXT1_GUITC|nr:hypothetical protein GUITHDRAFT_112816 [Guillardia theta CCMP2712]EKX41083.1 hypothetical protein GUITHDRAFT_112816 [Guillardia theta CCMP2712]|eukprot:XP_005828063.1 hypothetical protein GUITHDRAFT_112816 [Guillardia theta CCMP2712]